VPTPEPAPEPEPAPVPDGAGREARSGSESVAEAAIERGDLTHAEGQKAAMDEPAPGGEASVGGEAAPGGEASGGEGVEEARAGGGVPRAETEGEA
jgi:hypothetical protein